MQVCISKSLHSWRDNLREILAKLLHKIEKSPFAIDMSFKNVFSCFGI